MSKIIQFKRVKGYHKWLAFNWIHNPKMMGKSPHKIIMIRGMRHKVKH